MTQKLKDDQGIPDFQTKESLLGLADFFERSAKQLRFAAEQIESQSLEVAGTPTFRRGMGYVKNWLGNLFPAISSSTLDSVPDPDIAEAERRAAEIDSRPARATKKASKSTKKKAQ